MSEKDLRRRIPVNRKARPPHPSPSPSPSSPSSSSPSYHRRTTPAPRRSSKRPKPVKILERCNSEPTMRTAGLLAFGGDDNRNLTPPGVLLFRPQTCMDIFSSSPELLRGSPQKFEGYNKEAKVLVNVTVEGSPGPIRTMVKLGSSVEETIRLVVKNYSKEGRSPRIDGDVASTFELHHSYFSLQSLNKSEVIGEVGSRSFYLRTSNNDGDMRGEEMASASCNSVSTSIATPPFLFLPAFISRKVQKIIRRIRKLWKIVGCMQCNG